MSFGVPRLTRLPPRPLAAALSALALVLGAGCAGSVPSPRREARPAPPAELFRFESAFWVNLHHLLIKETEGNGKGAGAFAGGELEAAEREAWEAALTHYRDHIAGRDPLFDRELQAVRDVLAEAADGELPAEGLDPTLRAVLAAAAPVYRRTLWPLHDGANRDAIARLRADAETHRALAGTLAALFRSEWPPEPVRVDVSVYALWSGAYTTIRPTHITIAAADPRNQGSQGLEILFHEASHGLIEPVSSAIREERTRQGKEAPRDNLWHAVLFHTVGWAVQQRLPDHTPYAEEHGLWQRGWTSAETVLRRHWQPYLEGEASFGTAIAGMIRDL